MITMNKEEYLSKLDELNLDKDNYCIISGGSMLLYGLKETTADIDIKVLPSYFEKIKERLSFKKSPKFSYLYELSEDIEVAVLEFNKENINFVDGYPVESLELQLEWMIKNNREKDKDSIIKIKEYLESKRNIESF